MLSPLIRLIFLKTGCDGRQLGLQGIPFTLSFGLFTGPFFLLPLLVFLCNLLKPTLFLQFKVKGGSTLP